MKNLINRTSKDLPSIEVLKTVEFVFNDKKLEYITELNTKTNGYFLSLKWEEKTNLDFRSFPIVSCELCKKDHAVCNVVEYTGPLEYTGPFKQSRPTKQSIRIYFTNYCFQKILPFLKMLQPEIHLFSLIDPFNARDIPMYVVKKLIGDNKDVLLNFMVANLDR